MLGTTIPRRGRDAHEPCTRRDAIPPDRLFVTERRDGMICGPLRASRNSAIHIKGSIHDDSVATDLGFRGGTVAGSVHFDLFAPLLVHVLGPRWYERGTLSTVWWPACARSCAG